MLQVYETASCEIERQGMRERRRGENTIGRKERGPYIIMH